MTPALRTAFDKEMTAARGFYARRDSAQCFSHLERAHILGQRHYAPHVLTHWWMLKIGWQRQDMKEILGQMLRIVGSAGSLIGRVPIGNTGGANVSPLKPMPIPADLAIYFEDTD